MSAFLRLPSEYLADLMAAAQAMPPKNIIEIMQATQRQMRGEKVHIPAPRHLSPQNRRVRYAVDLMKAREKGNTCREPTPRQVRRHVARLGLSSFIPNQPPVGPDEV